MLLEEVLLEEMLTCLGHHLGHVWGIIWGMSGACLGQHLGHVWAIIWGMSGACLGQHLILGQYSGKMLAETGYFDILLWYWAYCQQWTTIRGATWICNHAHNISDTLVTGMPQCTAVRGAELRLTASTIRLFTPVWTGWKCDDAGNDDDEDDHDG